MTTRKTTNTLQEGTGRCEGCSGRAAGGEWGPGREKGEERVLAQSETDRRPASQMQRLQTFIFVKSQNIRIIESK